MYSASLYVKQEEYCIRTPPRGGINWVAHPRNREISRGPRNVPRAKPEGNLEVRGDVQPNISWLEAVYGHSLVINPYQGMYHKIDPCRAGIIGSVKIDTSLLLMRERTFDPIHPSSRQWKDTIRRSKKRQVLLQFWKRMAADCASCAFSLLLQVWPGLPLHFLIKGILRPNAATF